MKRLTLLFTLATLAFAQHRRGGPALQLLDADKDSVISIAEINNAPTALAKLDANADGQLTADELRPPGRPPADRDMAKSLMSFDKNADGKLSKSELPEQMQGMLARGDKDGDGFLTSAEIQAMVPAQPREGEGGMMRMDPLLSAIDADKNGIISFTEMQNSAAALRALDKDNDGQLSRPEIRPAFGGRGGRGPKQEKN